MSDPDRIDPLALINEFAKKEKQLAETTFLAPLTGGGKVRVQVDGVGYDMVVDQRDFEGWGVFRMTRPGHATLVERASIGLVGEYLKLFPRKRFVLIDRFDGEWFGIASSSSDSRFALVGPVPIRLVGGATVAPLDTVCTRFDGGAFYFDCVDRRRDPVVPRELRKQLEEKVEPDDARAAGMTPEERLAYRVVYLRRYAKDMPVDDRTRIANALRHADATLDSFIVDPSSVNEATVRFMVDEVMHTARIQLNDMSLVSAGICLSGEDRNFDLGSLVGVFREYQQRTGNRGWEEDYGW